ncbi:MAG: NAD(P)-dependent oxidoreductase [Thermoguttaceae bacterium]|nr:NAD(P)-dependent oxidoreductase [Thermoguttaceae bacterium]
MKPRIGWIGTGVMGRSMAGNLLKAGYPLTVYTRTKQKATTLLDSGAVWTESPARVAAASDVVFLMVGYPADVREVVLGEEGVLAGFRESLGRTEPPTVVDMTTSSPALAAEIFDAAKAQGADALDAPVSGGDIGARDGTLSIMVGGDEAVFRRIVPLFEVLGSKIVYQGKAGMGQHTKMVNQILIAGNMAGMCEALLYARRTGLDMEKVMSSVAAGAAGSWSLSNLAPRILRGDFAPGFFVEHFIKDMKIALDESARMNLRLPALDLVCRLYRRLASQGGGRLGTQALIKALDGLAEDDSF